MLARYAKNARWNCSSRRRAHRGGGRMHPGCHSNARADLDANAHGDSNTAAYANPQSYALANT